MLKNSHRCFVLTFRRYEGKRSPFATKYYERKRLQRIQDEQIDEPMNIGVLRTAFVDKSYVSIPPEEMSIRKIKAMPETDNELLASEGLQRILSVSEKFVKLNFPELPLDGVDALVKFFSSEKLLSEVGRNLGMDDMIIAQSYPHADDVIHRAFCACVEVISKHRSANNGRKFIEEFVCSQLLSRDLFCIWSIDARTAVQHINEILEKRSMERATPRLLHAANVGTVLPCFSIAFFSQEQFLASGSAETLSEAKKEAAVNTLRYLLNANIEHKLPISQTIR